MDKETIRIIDAAEALINRLHNETVFNPNITECNELYLALFSIGRCVESASQQAVEAEVLDGVSQDGCYIGDGFGGLWSTKCPRCGRKTIEIIRPGVARCVECY